MRKFPGPSRAALAALAVGILASTSCANPRTQANMAAALNDAANEIGALKDDIAMLQTQIDSLKTVMMHQDTVINRIAAVNNIPH